MIVIITLRVAMGSRCSLGRTRGQPPVVAEDALLSMLGGKKKEPNRIT